MIKHVFLIIAIVAAIAGFLYAPGPHVQVNTILSLSLYSTVQRSLNF